VDETDVDEVVIALVNCAKRVYDLFPFIFVSCLLFVFFFIYIFLSSAKANSIQLPSL